MEEILDQTQLAVTADEGSLEPGGLERSADTRDDAQRAPQRRQAILALQLEGAGVVVGDRVLRRSARRLAHEHRPGLGHRLHARGGVDEIAGHHALPFGAHRDSGLTGEHAGPRPEP